MEDNQKQDLEIAILELQATIQKIDLIQNDSVDQCKELDGVKENIQNAIVLIQGTLRWNFTK